MKHPIIHLLLPILALAASLCGCRKELPATAESTVTDTVPYTVTVREGPATRAGLDGDGHYIFETGDRLFVTGGEGKVYGALDLLSGAGQTTAVFEGVLICTDGFELAGDTPLSATLVGSVDRIHEPGAGIITATAYPADEYAADLADAIRKFSHFTGSGSYGEHSFTLHQQSAFLTLFLSFDGRGLSGEEELEIALVNGDAAGRTVRMKPAIAHDVAAVSCVLPFPDQYLLSQTATITVSRGETPLVSFADFQADKTLDANHYYTVSRTSAFYGAPVLILPPTEDYNDGQQFPVRVALDPGADDTDKQLITSDFKIRIHIILPDGSEQSQDVAPGPLAAGAEDLDPETFLNTILNGGDKLGTSGEYQFKLELSQDNGATWAQVGKTVRMKVLRSKYEPNREAWSDMVGALAEGDFVEAKIAVNRDKKLAHILGFGTVLEGAWAAVDAALFYYPAELNNYYLRFHGRHANTHTLGQAQIDAKFDFESETSVWKGKRLVLRFDYSGIYWNEGDISRPTENSSGSVSDASRDNYLSTYRAWFGADNLAVGSKEGNNRSSAYYEYIRVVRYE